jgi:hypothetical protein
MLQGQSFNATCYMLLLLKKVINKLHKTAFHILLLLCYFFFKLQLRSTITQNLKTNTGIPHLALLHWLQKNRALSETALSEGTFPIRINVNRSNLYSQRVLQR